MIDPRREAALKLAQAMAARNGAGPPGPAMAPRPAPQQLGPIPPQQIAPQAVNSAARGVPGDQNGVQYEAHPNAQAAEMRLQQLRAQGRDGMIQPLPNGTHGVGHWPMQ